MSNKISLAEAMKQKLEQKKQAQASAKQQKHAQNGNQHMKSQIAKKNKPPKKTVWRIMVLLHQELEKSSFFFFGAEVGF